MARMIVVVLAVYATIADALFTRADPKNDKVDLNKPMPIKAPEQGFEGKNVQHKDGETVTKDWRREYGAKVRIGGHIQDDYLSAFDLYKTWANKDGRAATEPWLSFKTFNSATMAADVAKMTTSGDATYVDVLICPYGSKNVIACVKAVNKDFTGPVIAWGGASDTIFDTTCAALPNKNCFGFFTVGSDYTKSGLMALDAKVKADAHVALIVNDNPFSRSVAEGAKATIAAEEGLILQSNTTISVAKKALTDADKDKIWTLMEKKPDIVVIAGHNVDVEHTIIAIGKAIAADPKSSLQAIIATNGISKTVNYGDDSKYAQCVMMPTQWDSSTSIKDTVIGWDSAAFVKAMGGSATYQQASAGAVGVAIANALKTQPDVTKLVATMQAMDVESFYGKLKWDANGRIQKPMYTQQLQVAATTVVAPTGTANMKFPLGVESCWNFGDAAEVVAGVTTNTTDVAVEVTSSAILRFLSMPAVLSMVFAMLS